MLINRNNYENFFLLYVDGELTPQEMLEVDAFCQKHPDLHEALLLLMDTRLDNVQDLSFPGKEDLLMPELWDADHLTPVQVSMLNQLDGEAPDDAPLLHWQSNPLLQKEWNLLLQTQCTPEPVAATNKQALIRLLPWNADALTPTQMHLLEVLENGGQPAAGLLADIEIDKDWALLQRTVMQAEALAMPHKQKLYRTETPVVRMGWWRIAAAAAVIGLGWFAVANWGSQHPTTGNPTPTLALQTIPAQPQTPLQKMDLAPDQDAASTPNNAQPAQASMAASVSPEKINTTRPPQNKKSTEAVPADNREQMAQEIAAFRLNKTTEGSAVAIPSESNTLPKGKQPALVPNNQDVAAVLTQAPPPTHSDMRFDQAVAIEEASDESEYITIAGARVKKQKIRGLFRNVSRTITRSFDKSNVKEASSEEAKLR